MRAGLLACALLLLPATGWAEWQFKPFVGVTFGGENTLLDLDQVAGEKKFTLGGSATWLGNFVGVEGDVGRVPGFFQTVSQQAVLSSSVTTLTGNVVLTLPRKITQYGLRPYVVAGGGVVRASIDLELETLNVRTSLKVVDFGAGATGFLNDRIGVSWDVRYFRSLGGKEGTGLAIGREQLSFWRATMGVAIRPGGGR
jgi:hypothetical protein